MAYIDSTDKLNFSSKATKLIKDFMSNIEEEMRVEAWGHEDLYDVIDELIARDMPFNGVETINELETSFNIDIRSQLTDAYFDEAVNVIYARLIAKVLRHLGDEL